MSWQIKWSLIHWLSIFGHNFARNDFAWTVEHPWVLISTESFLFFPFWLSSEQPAFGVAPTYLTLITNEPWLPGLRWTGHKKDELSRDFLICCGKSRWKKHAAALSSPQSQPKAQTAVASVKANAARRLQWRGAAASRLIQFFSRKKADELRWCEVLEKTHGSMMALTYQFLNSTWTMSFSNIFKVLKLQNKRGLFSDEC